MSSQNGSDRVTNRQLYQELTALRKELPSRLEMRISIALAVLGSNALAAIVLRWAGGVDVVRQAAAAIGLP